MDSYGEEAGLHSKVPFQNNVVLNSGSHEHSLHEYFRYIIYTKRTRNAVLALALYSSRYGKQVDREAIVRSITAYRRKNERCSVPFVSL